MSTKIEWTDATWNPVTGCSKVSPGCAHCYAEAVTQRYAGRPGWPADFKPWTPDNAAANVVLHPERLDAPLHWRKPRRVFVNSMSDLFHEQVPDEFIDRVFAVMALCEQHTFQILTKRPERMLAFCSREAHWWGNKAGIARRADYGKPLPNVHLGVSAENQHWADERIPLLLQTPAAVHFISAEPLLGDLNIEPWIPVNAHSTYRAARGAVKYASLPSLDWVIVGGESGAGHRPMDLAWVRSLRDQCRAAGVAYFGKQAGGPRPGIPLPGDLGDQEAVLGERDVYGDQVYSVIPLV